MIGSTNESRWTVPRWGEFAWATWDEGYSLFDGGTGETHLLNELPAEILRRLAARPHTAAELASALSRECEVEDDGAWRTRILEVLENLALLDLVESSA